MVVIFYFIAKKPSKFPYLKTVKISLKPDRLSMSKFPFVENGSKTLFKDLDLEIISLAEYPLDIL